ncbi:MAG: Peptidyl-prolyl cis-trans isomerase D [Candidatus Cloacimonetes bacterium ADurb.Bin211]|jgi:parvulin-like peptidyl-prolyl isomerase|nr:MAG: Peptidyl-prolyl cis-trans isomerase D [Candidatus Cloacimonetes bacterium ADurb.Bin211]
MLDQLVKKQKVIIYIVAIAFIISLGAGGIFGGERIIQALGGNYIGKVNGTKITPQQYNLKIQEIKERYESQGQRVDESYMPYIQNTAWEELVNEILWQQQIKKHRIKVTEAEIKNAIENDIPQELLQNESLQTNGVFDKKKYFQALNNSPQFKLQMYEYMKTYLPRKKLQQKIMSEANITLDSLKQEYIKDNDKVYGKAIWFSYHKADSVYVSDAEIKKYYEEHKDTEFKKGPASRIKYITIPIQPSERDYNEVKLEIEDIYKMVNAENFPIIAEQYSEDEGSAKQGGSLGVFGKGQMVPEFEKVAFSLKPGEISKPFKTDFGWHIVKCDSLGTDQIKASHILLKVTTSDETKRELYEKAKQARKLIAKKGIDAAAKELKLEVITSDWLPHDTEQMPGIGQHGGLYQFMVKKKPGKVSDVFQLNYQGKPTYLVAQVIENRKFYYEDFNTKKLQIKYELEKQKKIAKVKTKAEDFIKRVPKDRYFDVAAAEGWDIIELNGHKKGSRLPAPVNATLEEFDKAALALNTGEYSNLVNTKEGPFIIYAERREKPNMQAFTKEKQEEIRKRLEEAAFNRWWQQIRKEAKIIDNRYKYGYY